MRRRSWFVFIFAVLILAGCSPPVRVSEYPSLDWSINAQKLRQLGCVGALQDSCPQLAALGCDEINGPSFYLGGLEPDYPVLECIHNQGEPPDREHFKQLAGLDTRYRSYAIYKDGEYRLLNKKSEFREIFAPVESTDEALSYAMAITGLEARFDIDPKANVDYLVELIEETHAEETANGYLVYLFDWSHKMGCDVHPFYAVKVLVTREGEVREVERQEIYRGEACFDFESLTLDGD